MTRLFKYSFVLCLFLLSCRQHTINLRTAQYDTVVKKPPAGARLCGPGQRYVTAKLPDVGIDRDEEPVAQAIIDYLITDPRVDLVATYDDESYEVYSARGFVRFRRFCTPENQVVFQVLETKKSNPIAKQNPSVYRTLDEMLQAGTNPHGFSDKSHPRCDYQGPDDPRMQFLSPDTATYPFAYSRLSSVFDSPNSPDLLLSYAPYAGAGSESGHYGELNVADSRGLLIMRGAGVKPGKYAGVARLRDVAPTVARLLNFSPLPGNKMLQGQDGQELAKLLTGEPVERVLVINLSGMSNLAFQHLLETKPERFSVYTNLIQTGAHVADGLIAPFPSKEWPAHFTLATGADVGHHGILDNVFFLRQLQHSMVVKGDHLLADQIMAPAGQVETIFEGLRRNRPGSADRMLSAAFGLLATRGADRATLTDIGEDELAGGQLDPAKTALSPILPLDKYFCDEELRGVFKLEQLTGFRLAKLLEEADSPRPILIVWSLVSYLMTAHKFGPYSSCAGLAAWYQAQIIEQMLELMRINKLLDRTAVILLSDHGMRGVDHQRSGNVVEQLRGLGFVVKGSAQHLLYLPMIKIESKVDGALTAGEEASIQLTCRDSDTNAPVAKARLLVLAPGGGELETITDEEGQATLSLVPEGEWVIIEVQHKKYNPGKVSLPVQKQ